ncbi:hypothetical protein CT138_03600 [Mannheimia varigena]|uniref:hypothetical protein n=1 Tax=Mannheimia varigena TaxID=85404 RepID=UPI00046D4FC6|nr:hypothetical protein [Mannheimia varigena]AWW33983.1 hypothetical protein CT138_03600 [Mannheimia varigena]
MRVIILMLSIILFSSCTLFEHKHSKVVKAALEKPIVTTKFARIRIFPTINKRGYNDYLGVYIVENGKLKFVGFSRYGNKNISLGMPKSNTYKYAVENNQLFGEYVVPANLPIIVGYSNREYCSEGWIFRDCWEHRTEQYFIPEPNKDYDIINGYHVYEVDKLGNQKRIDSTGEIIRSWKK